MTGRRGEKSLSYLIGMDDTDNLESRGTGYRARMLGLALQETGLGRLRSVTRHQLLVHPDIRYTSHNSSACLVLDGCAGISDIEAFCVSFLKRESAEGSDAGLCVLPQERVDPSVRLFGLRAKQDVLDQAEAYECAGRSGALLRGLTGDGGGVIGAIAAVGLRSTGDDGRFLWLPGLRELLGTATAADLWELARIEVVQSVDGLPLAPEALVELGDWVRPVLQGGRSVLLVEPSGGDSDGWRVAARDFIKRRSE